MCADRQGVCLRAPCTSRRVADMSQARFEYLRGFLDAESSAPSIKARGRTETTFPANELWQRALPGGRALGTSKRGSWTIPPDSRRGSGQCFSNRRRRPAAVRERSARRRAGRSVARYLVRVLEKLPCMAPFCQVFESLQRLQIRSPDQWLMKGVLHLRHGLSLATSGEPPWPRCDIGEFFSTGIRSAYSSDRSRFAWATASLRLVYLYWPSWK